MSQSSNYFFMAFDDCEQFYKVSNKLWILGNSKISFEKDWWFSI